MSETTPPETIERLERLATACVHGDPWYSSADLDCQRLPLKQDRLFIAACSPAVVLALVKAARLAAERGERIRELEAELAEALAKLSESRSHASAEYARRRMGF